MRGWVRETENEVLSWVCNGGFLGKGLKFWSDRLESRWGVYKDQKKKVCAILTWKGSGTFNPSWYWEWNRLLYTRLRWHNEEKDRTFTGTRTITVETNGHRTSFPLFLWLPLVLRVGWRVSVHRIRSLFKSNKIRWLYNSDNKVLLDRIGLTIWLNLWGDLTRGLSEETLSKVLTLVYPYTLSKQSTGGGWSYIGGGPEQVKTLGSWVVWWTVLRVIFNLFTCVNNNLLQIFHRPYFVSMSFTSYCYSVIKKSDNTLP